MNDDLVSGIVFVLIVIFGFVWLVEYFQDTIELIFSFLFYALISLVVGGTVIGFVFFCYEENVRWKRQHQAHQTLIENRARIEQARPEVIAHFQNVMAEDSKSVSRNIAPLIQQVKFLIKLSDPDDRGRVYPVVLWDVPPTVLAKILIYRGSGVLLQSIKQLSETEEQLELVEVANLYDAEFSQGEGGLHDRACFTVLDAEPGQTANYYVYWVYNHTGFTPCLEIGDETIRAPTDEHFLADYRLSKLTYQYPIKEGFVAARITVPEYVDPLDDLQARIERDNRRRALEREAQRKGLLPTSEASPKILVRAAYDAELAEAFREQELYDAFEEIEQELEGRVDIPRELKRDVKRRLQQRLADDMGDA